MIQLINLKIVDSFSLYNLTVDLKSKKNATIDCLRLFYRKKVQVVAFHYKVGGGEVAEKKLGVETFAKILKAGVGVLMMQFWDIFWPER